MEQINFLIKLQVIDKTVFDLENELKEIPERLAQLAAQEEAARQEFQRFQAELEALVKQRKALESESEDAKGRLRKAETKLMNSKNQKEHRAATAEMEDGRDVIRATDDHLLLIMEKEQPLAEKLETLSRQLEEQNKLFLETKARTEQRQEEARNILDEITKGRNELENQVEKTLLREYNFIRSRRAGVAISPVSKGNCGICHMQISPQQFNELKRGGKLMYCPSCKRIIYWSEAEGLNG